MPSGNLDHRIAALQEENFARGRDFVPERWTDDDEHSTTENKESFLVMPFGIGKRSCPGKRLAQQGPNSIEIILA